MGTSLTGLTPATTYDALIKVGDNGPLTGSLKTISDGLGNDSTLSLSTGAASIGGTLAVTGATNLSSSLTANGLIKSTVAGAGFRHFYNNGAGSIEVSQRSDNKLQLYAYTGSAYTDILLGVDGSTVGGNVGIGTTAPLGKLDVADSSLSTIALTATGEATDQKIWIYQYGATVGSGTFRLRASNDAASNGQNAVIIKRTGFNVDNHQFLTSGSERVRISDNGLSFNGDTAAANALDDYEEGTFTATLTPSTSGTIVLSPDTCTYTKIGRQVTVRGQIVVSAVSSPVGSIVILGGLPFTSQNSVSSRGAGVFQYFPSVGTGSLLLNYQLQNSVEVNLILTASTIGAGAEFYVSLTYFV